MTSQSMPEEGKGMKTLLRRGFTTFMEECDDIWWRLHHSCAGAWCDSSSSAGGASLSKLASECEALRADLTEALRRFARTWSEGWTEGAKTGVDAYLAFQAGLAQASVADAYARLSHMVAHVERSCRSCASSTA